MHTNKAALINGHQNQLAKPANCYWYCVILFKQNEANIKAPANRLNFESIHLSIKQTSKIRNSASEWFYLATTQLQLYSEKINWDVMISSMIFIKKNSFPLFPLIICK